MTFQSWIRSLGYVGTMDYWFGFKRGALSYTFRIMVFLAVVSLLTAVVLKLKTRTTKSPVTKKLLSRYTQPLLTMGILFAIWIPSRYEELRFFGSHVVALILVLLLFVWLAPTVLYHIRKFALDKRMWEKESLKRKYLPPTAYTN